MHPVCIPFVIITIASTSTFLTPTDILYPNFIFFHVPPLPIVSVCILISLTILRTCLANCNCMVEIPLTSGWAKDDIQLLVCSNLRF
ncbi:hypothetical protein DFH27DRAFT_577723 [Peziza echinospora]|nr:hypothetical protein DFH27DRAFT_577723 [Peziza echinospora]